MHGIHTVWKRITCHPLFDNFPSLSWYHGYLEDATQIKLNPLVMIIVPGCPASHVPTSAHALQSSKEWCVVAVPHGWWSNLTIFDATVLDAKGIAANPCQFWNITSYFKGFSFYKCIRKWKLTRQAAYLPSKWTPPLSRRLFSKPDTFRTGATSLRQTLL